MSMNRPKSNFWKFSHWNNIGNSSYPIFWKIQLTCIHAIYSFSHIVFCLKYDAQNFYLLMAGDQIWDFLKYLEQKG